MLLTLGLFLSTLFSPNAPSVYRISIQNKIIQPVIAEYIQETVAKAESEKAAAVLIVLDTPGGLLESTHEIVKTLLNAKVKTIVYVSPTGARAASAGPFITLAAEVAAMAPSTHIGAAHPVQLGEVDKLKEKSPTPSAMEEKVMQDTLAWVEGTAKTRGRNVEWAKRSVSESVSVDAGEALQLKVIDLIAVDEKELLAKLDLSGSPVIDVPMTLSQEILTVLIHPNIAYILMILGFYGLLFEITHPGAIFPGVAGAVCLIVSLYAMHILPTNYAGLGLMLMAVILFAAELYLPSYGLLGLGALVCLTLGSLFLFHAPGEFLRVSFAVMIPTVLAAAALGVFLATLVWRSQNRRVVTGLESLVGMSAEVVDTLDPAGKVFLQGELWDARSDEKIGKGEKVIVAEIKGMELKVKKLTAKS